MNVIKVAGLCACLFILTPVAFAKPVIVQSEDAKRVFVHKGLTAIIAAPKEVELFKSRSFKVFVQIKNVAGQPHQPFPDTVTLRGFGTHSTQPVQLENGRGSAMISFPEQSWPSKEPYDIEVTAADDPSGFMGHVDVTLRDVASIEVVEAPKNLSADGKATGKIVAIVKDQFGKVLSDVPSILRYDLPKSSSSSIALLHSNVNGEIEFMAPPTFEIGDGFFQIELVGSGVATPQTFVRYRSILETPETLEH